MTQDATLSDHTTPSLWMLRAEVAAHLRVHLATLDKWAARGTGPPYHKLAGRLVRYRRDEVDAWASGDTRLHTADDGTAVRELARVTPIRRRRRGEG